MAGHTERDETRPVSEMQPHRKHAGVYISNNLRDSEECEEMLAHAEKHYAPVERIVKLHVHNSSQGVKSHKHKWDTLLYFPKPTYDHPDGGYILSPAGTIEEVPPNYSGTIRVSYVIQLKMRENGDSRVQPASRAS